MNLLYLREKSGSARILDSTKQWDIELGKWRITVCCLLFVAAVCRYWGNVEPRRVVPHDPESFRLARSLVETGTYANPFQSLDTGPSAHMAPAFPAYMAGLIRLFGEGTHGMAAIQLSAVLVIALQIALLPVFSASLGMGTLNGIIAALIWIAAAPGWTFGWEQEYAAVCLAATVCVFRQYLWTPRVGYACLTGVLLGLLVLLSPTVGIVALAFIPILPRFLKSGLIFLVAAAIVAPWTVRNCLAFHQLIIGRDNLGIELAVSNNDLAEYGIQQNFDNGCFGFHHPNLSLPEANQALMLGEAQYNTVKMREAITWIEEHPTRFTKLCIERAIAFWMPPAFKRPWWSLFGDDRALERLPICILTLLSLPGLFLLYRKDRLSAWLCLSCLVLYPLVYYLVQWDYRYRYPILWITFFLGSLPISALVRSTYTRLRDKTKNRSSN